MTGMINVSCINYHSKPKGSFLERIPPYVKLLLTFSVALCVALLNSLMAQIFLLMYSIVLVGLSGVPVKRLLKRLMAVDGFVLMLWLTLPFSSEEGVVTATLITIRVHAAVLAFMALLQTTSMPEILQALCQLRFPSKLVALLHFTYRYIHVLAEEASRIHRSMALRGFEPSLNLRTFRAYGYLIGMLLLRSFVRSQRVYNAMLLRGFNGTYIFLTFKSRLSRPDFLKLAVLYALLVGCLMV